MADRFAAEEFLQDLHAFGQPRASLMMRHIAGGIFLRKFSSDPHTQNEPAFSEVIEGQDLLRDGCRMT